MTLCLLFLRAFSIHKPADARKLESRIGYEFSDALLLEQALTHKSFASSNNERLEFLGDAVLGYVIAGELFRVYPDAGEDELTLMRARLVRKDCLHELATRLELGEYLRLGVGERKSGGRERASILADALEAVFGAIVLDGGVDAARRVITDLYADRIATANAGETKDPKTRLQELLQSRQMDLPEYEIVRTSGSEHRRIFEVSCAVAALSLVTAGVGRSRRSAEKAAALAMLERIDDDAD